MVEFCYLRLHYYIEAICWRPVFRMAMMKADLKLKNSEKDRQFFRILKPSSEKIGNQLLWFAIPAKFVFDIFFVILQEHFWVIFL